MTTVTVFSVGGRFSSHCTFYDQFWVANTLIRFKVYIFVDTWLGREKGEGLTSWTVFHIC